MPFSLTKCFRRTPITLSMFPPSHVSCTKHTHTHTHTHIRAYTQVCTHANTHAHTPRDTRSHAHIVKSSQSYCLCTGFCLIEFICKEFACIDSVRTHTHKSRFTQMRMRHCINRVPIAGCLGAWVSVFVGVSVPRCLVVWACG